MKYKTLLFGAASLLLAACSNEIDMPDNLAMDGGKAPLSVNVMTNPTTKALVDGTALPGGSKIGVKLVKSDGTKYDNQAYNNIYYNSTDGTTWVVDPAHPIMLSATEGKAFAYFPYEENASLDFKAISITSAADPASQTDYMFGNVASGLKNSNPTASFTMSHAMSIVNFVIAKGSYTGTGAITSVKMSGNTASNTGTMNAEAGTVTATNAGYEFTSTNSLSLGSSTGKFIVVPSGTASKLDFKVTMDGQTYTASTAEVTLQSGQVYKYTLTMNSIGMSVSQVSVTPWGTAQDMGTLDTELQPSISPVYAMKADGTLVNLANANEDSYAGIAIDIRGKKYQIAKKDATDETGIPFGTPPAENAETFPYFSKPLSDYDLICYPMFFHEDVDQYFVDLMPEPFEGVNYQKITKDDSSWTSGAISDFEGFKNTRALVDFQGSTTNTIGHLVKTVNESADIAVNEGKSNWFVPSFGEFAYIMVHWKDIQKIIDKVDGFVDFETNMKNYWTSTVQQALSAYCNSTAECILGELEIDTSLDVRLIREIAE